MANNNSDRLALKTASIAPMKTAAMSSAGNAGKDKSISALSDKLRLAKKKRDIISGQNDRIAGGNGVRVQTTKNGVTYSNEIGL